MFVPASWETRRRAFFVPRAEHVTVMSPRIRLYGAWVLLVASLILWPVSMFTFARDEPRAILSLSWFAITLTCYDIVATSDVRKEQDDGKA